jgi:hypothetical protein
MPTVAIIDGIKIKLYWDEHFPAHFHAELAEYEAQIAIDNLRVIEGYIPTHQLRKVIAWARPRKTQLFKAWMTCQADLHPGKIP